MAKDFGSSSGSGRGGMIGRLVLYWHSAATALLMTTCSLAAIPYSAWEAAPELWQKGYVLGILDYSSKMFWSDDQKAFAKHRDRCYATIGTSSDQLISS